MRLVVVIDGELLVPQDSILGIQGQREEVNHTVAALGELLRSQHELVITHGNSSQIGYVLLRAEVASHIVHPLPLDICGADTQGATGYLLQQSLRNWMHQHKVQKEVVTLVTQALVDIQDPAFANPSRGIGPYYDREKAQSYSATRDWDFVVVPGRGYRRAVPALTPKKVIEARPVVDLLKTGSIVICAGGGGVPVYQDQGGNLAGVEAVVDKALTSALLAVEIGADALIFVSVWDKVEQVFRTTLNGQPYQVPVQAVDGLVNGSRPIDEDICNKLLACKYFLNHGGQKAILAPLGKLSSQPERLGGVHIIPG